MIYLLVAMQGRQMPLPLLRQPVAVSKVRTSLSSDSGDTISLARDTWPGWLDTAVRYAAFSRLISRAYIIPSKTPLVAELVALLVLGAFCSQDAGRQVQ